MFNFQRSARSKGDKQVTEYINPNHNSFTRIVSKALHLVFVAALVAGLALSVAPVPVAHAATITVTTTADELISDGNCSLREAIQAANTDAAVDACLAGSGADTIVLPAGTYTLSIAGAGEDANATGDLDITADLTINGAGAGATIIDGNASDRVFDTAFGLTITITGVRIQNGSANVAGGIANDGTLTLNSSTVSGNTATIERGGIDNFGTLILNNSTVSGNTAPRAGGIENDGTMTINSSTVSGNTAGEHGGGIENFGTLILNGSTVTSNTAGSGAGLLNAGGSTLTLNNSTVTSNTATSISGGGIDNSGNLTLNTSTVSGNSAGTEGGGISSRFGTVTLNNSTVSGNLAIQGAGIISGGTLTLNSSTISGNTGFGILAFGTATLNNTIVANNSPSDCSDSIPSGGHNLDSDGTCGLTGPGDLVNTNPLLGPLADNGGPTQTHALLAGSPAIDAGNPDCPPPATDQRGVTRPQGAACDIGAFELASLTVIYNFSGFFQPVDNLPTLNMVKAGQAIPVKFSLNGDQGLNIFAAGYPRSQDIQCNSTTVVDGIEVTVTAGSSSLSYNPSTDTYTYVWKTDKAWANTCRQLVVKLNDGTEHVAYFKFK